VTSDGIPLGYEVFAGNRNDASTLAEIVEAMEQKYGRANRKRTDEPGPQTVWLGLQRMHDIALCWQVFGPEAKMENQLV